MQRKPGEGILKRDAQRLRQLGMALVIAGCGSPAVLPSPPPAPVTLADAVVPENVDAYRNGGFVVGAGSIPFVGLVRFAATEFLDSTAVVVTLSIPPRSLSFVRAGDRYAAFYALRIDVLRGDAIVRSERPTGEVRVASFAETTRGDEGVIFQRTLRVTPGAYALRVTAQDSLGTGSGTASSSVVVPAMSDGTVAPMIPVFVAEPRRTRGAPLTIVVNPRATVRYGRDSVFELYVEAYGSTAPDTIVIVARRAPAGAVLLTDTVVTEPSTGVRAARVTLPVYGLGLGAVRIVASRLDDSEIDSMTAMVNLGLELPVSSVGELIEALRYFVGESDLQRLRSASDPARPAQWAALVRRTDPNPATPDNEALLEYARRLRIAERLYREPSMRGWQTDRGSVTAALGEPDVITDPQPADSIGGARLVTWEYRRHRLFLVFGDATGPWRLTPASAADFRALLALAGPCVSCR
jgi:GWxTD domain-containing protein